MAWPGPRKQADGELAAQVLAELAQPLEHAQLACPAPQLERRIVQAEAELRQQCERCARPWPRRAAQLGRSSAVEREPDADGLAVPQPMLGQALELVRRPVPVVERTRAAELEGIARRQRCARRAAGRTARIITRVASGSSRASSPACSHNHSKKRASRISATLTASAMPATRSRSAQRAEEREVVDDGERHREAAHEVLHAEGVDAVLHADTRVVLTEHGGRQADHAHAAMTCRSGKAGHVLHGAATDDHTERLPVEPDRRHALVQGA